MFRALSQKEIDWRTSSTSIIIITEPKVNLSAAIVFLIATATGRTSPTGKMIKVRYCIAPLVPVRVNFHVICHVESAELLRGVFDLAVRPAPSGPCPCACPPSENPPSESRATYAPRQGWPNPILLFARLGAAELHDCKRNAEIRPSRRVLQVRCRTFTLSARKFGNI